MGSIAVAELLRHILAVEYDITRGNAKILDDQQINVLDQSN